MYDRSQPRNIQTHTTGRSVSAPYFAPLRPTHVKITILLLLLYFQQLRRVINVNMEQSAVFARWVACGPSSRAGHYHTAETRINGREEEEEEKVETTTIEVLRLFFS